MTTTSSTTSTTTNWLGLGNIDFTDFITDFNDTLDGESSVTDDLFNTHCDYCDSNNCNGWTLRALPDDQFDIGGTNYEECYDECFDRFGLYNGETLCSQECSDLLSQRDISAAETYGENSVISNENGYVESYAASYTQSDYLETNQGVSVFYSVLILPFALFMQSF